jgi:hypothetical protein
MTEAEREDIPLVEGDDPEPDIEPAPVDAEGDADTDQDTGDMDLTGQHFQADPDDDKGLEAGV